MNTIIMEVVKGRTTFVKRGSILTEFKFCSNCGQRNRVAARFCKECGTSFRDSVVHKVTPQKKICSSCKTVNDHDAEFCKKCAALL